MSEFSDDKERELNPAPPSFKVGLKLRAAFFVFALLSCLGYAYMLMHKRLMQERYMLENEVAALKLAPTYLRPIKLVDPMTEQVEELSFAGDQFILLNLWASFCAPCLMEMPSLALLDQNRSSELKLIAVAMDDEVLGVKEFIKTQKPRFKILWDKDKELAARFNINKYPETFLITPDAYVITQFTGPRDWVSLSMHKYFSNILNANKKSSSLEPIEK